MASAIYVALANRPTLAAMTATTRLTDNSVGDTTTGHSATVTAVASGCGTANAESYVTFAWAEQQNCGITALRFTGRATPSSPPGLVAQCGVNPGEPGWASAFSANYSIEYGTDAGGAEPTWVALTSGTVVQDLTFRDFVFTTAINARYLRGVLYAQSYQEGIASIPTGSYQAYTEPTDFRVTYSAPPCSPPSPPTLTAGQLCSTGGVSIPLTWNELPTAYYEVERSSVATVVYGGTATNTTVTGLTAAIPEYFRIRAMDGCGTGMWGAYTTVVPKTFITALPTVTGELSCCGKRQTVAWDAVAQAATYSLYHRVPVLYQNYDTVLTGTTLATYPYTVPSGYRPYVNEWAVVPANDCGNGPTGTAIVGPLYGGGSCEGGAFTAGGGVTGSFTAGTCVGGTWAYPDCDS